VKFEENLETIENIIGYRFRDRSLLRQAFTRTSYCNEQNRGRRVKFQSSEVLEFIGDSVLSLAIITLLIGGESERYELGLSTELNEGDFSNIKAKLSNKSNLSKSTEGLGLQDYLIMGEGDERLGIGNQPSVMEDLFESIVGAIYIDSDMKLDPVIESVRKMLDVSVYKRGSDGGKKVTQSAKNELQEWCADKTRRLPPPQYKTLSESGPDHKKVYLRGCYIGDELYAAGEGKNQKEADGNAARAALERLMALDFSATEKNEYSRCLRAYAASEHLPPPKYTDLGETARSTSIDREFSVECTLSGKSAVGIGKSKKEAKNAAAMKLLTNFNKK